MTKLNTLFPAIRSRKDILQEIRKKPELSHVFFSWTEEQQEDFLDMCSGARGIRILADGFAKEILNPEYAPERLEEFLSLVLKRNVKILTILPNDSTRIANESALIVTDIVIEFSDHSIANVEIQRIGYKFPGQRSACYSADLLLRQYKRIRSQKKKAFTYKDVKSVYTIVLYENSPKNFHSFKNDYIHFTKQKSDTGLEINLLQEYVFISLDIFKENLQNKGINSKLDAWLTFFSSDKPETIAELLSKYPEFKPYYEEMYELCQNMEKVINMFSKELYELDRNTERYMFEEMQEAMKEMEVRISELGTQINELGTQVSEKNAQISELDTQVSEKNAQISEQDARISEKDAQISEKDARISAIEKENAELKALLRQLQGKDI